MIDEFVENIEIKRMPKIGWYKNSIRAMRVFPREKWLNCKLKSNQVEVLIAFQFMLFSKKVGRYVGIFFKELVEIYSVVETAI